MSKYYIKYKKLFEKENHLKNLFHGPQECADLSMARTVEFNILI